MYLQGINYSKNQQGKRVSTIHVIQDFDDYFVDETAGRGCLGKKVESIYVGDYDCTGLKIGSKIDVFYNKAVTTSRGTFQTVKSIIVLNENK